MQSSDFQSSGLSLWSTPVPVPLLCFHTVNPLMPVHCSPLLFPCSGLERPWLFLFKAGPYQVLLSLSEPRMRDGADCLSVTVCLAAV